MFCVGFVLELENLRSRNICPVSPFWIESCHLHKCILPIYDNLLYLPRITVSRSIATSRRALFNNLGRICITNFVDHERATLIKLLQHVGVDYAGSLRSSECSYLICKNCEKFDVSEKYTIAKKGNINIVNLKWIIDCIGDNNIKCIKNETDYKVFLRNNYYNRNSCIPYEYYDAYSNDIAVDSDSKLNHTTVANDTFMIPNVSISSNNNNNGNNNNNNNGNHNGNRNDRNQEFLGARELDVDIDINGNLNRHNNNDKQSRNRRNIGNGRGMDESPVSSPEKARSMAKTNQNQKYNHNNGNYGCINNINSNVPTPVFHGKTGNRNFIHDTGNGKNENSNDLPASLSQTAVINLIDDDNDGIDAIDEMETQQVGIGFNIMNNHSSRKKANTNTNGNVGNNENDNNVMDLLLNPNILLDVTTNDNQNNNNAIHHQQNRTNNGSINLNSREQSNGNNGSMSANLGEISNGNHSGNNSKRNKSNNVPNTPLMGQNGHHAQRTDSDETVWEDTLDNIAISPIATKFTQSIVPGNGVMIMDNDNFSPSKSVTKSVKAVNRIVAKRKNGNVDDGLDLAKEEEKLQTSYIVIGDDEEEEEEDGGNDDGRLVVFCNRDVINQRKHKEMLKKLIQMGKIRYTKTFSKDVTHYVVDKDISGGLTGTRKETKEIELAKQRASEKNCKLKIIDTDWLYSRYANVLKDLNKNDNDNENDVKNDSDVDVSEARQMNQLPSKPGGINTSTQLSRKSKNKNKNKNKSKKAKRNNENGTSNRNRNKAQYKALSMRPVTRKTPANTNTDKSTSNKNRGRARTRTRKEFEAEMKADSIEILDNDNDVDDNNDKNKNIENETPDVINLESMTPNFQSFGQIDEPPKKRQRLMSNGNKKRGGNSGDNNESESESESELKVGVILSGIEKKKRSHYWNIIRNELNGIILNKLVDNEKDIKEKEIISDNMYDKEYLFDNYGINFVITIAQKLVRSEKIVVSLVSGFNILKPEYLDLCLENGSKWIGIERKKKNRMNENEFNEFNQFKFNQNLNYLWIHDKKINNFIEQEKLKNRNKNKNRNSKKKTESEESDDPIHAKLVSVSELIKAIKKWKECGPILTGQNILMWLPNRKFNTYNRVLRALGANVITFDANYSKKKNQNHGGTEEEEEEEDETGVLKWIRLMELDTKEIEAQCQSIADRLESELSMKHTKSKGKCDKLLDVIYVAHDTELTSCIDLYIDYKNIGDQENVNTQEIEVKLNKKLLRHAAAITKFWCLNYNVESLDCDYVLDWVLDEFINGEQNGVVRKEYVLLYEGDKKGADGPGVK